MRGRDYFPIKKVISINLLFVLATILFGCQNDSNNTEKEQNINYSQISITNNSDNYFSIEDSETKNITDIPVEENSIAFEGSSDFTYPSDINFVPTFLNDDNILFGEADESINRSKLFLASYDLNTGDFHKLKDIDLKSDYSAIGIITANKDYVIYEENNQKVNTSIYYLYDLNNKEYSKIYTIDGIPQLHYTEASFCNDGIMFNFYSTEGYKNKFLNINTKKVIDIENENCGYPVFYKGFWYYIIIDNQNSITQLIKFDMDNLTKEVIYQTDTTDNYLSGIYCNEDRLFLMIQSSNTKKCYEVNIDEKNINYIFESDWIESVLLNKKYMTWLGSNTLENRNRPQYYLFNLDNYNQEINEDGKIFLSNNGIVRIKYKKSDAEITKGTIYTNENSSISLKAND